MKATKVEKHKKVRRFGLPEQMVWSQIKAVRAPEKRGRVEAEAISGKSYATLNSHR